MQDVAALRHTHADETELLKYMASDLIAIAFWTD